MMMDGEGGWLKVMDHDNGSLWWWIIIIMMDDDGLWWWMMMVNDGW